jgi:hypothetical protein
MEHNGLKAGGVARLASGRPWRMVAWVGGFPTWKHALKCGLVSFSCFLHLRFQGHTRRTSTAEHKVTLEEAKETAAREGLVLVPLKKNPRNKNPSGYKGSGSSTLSAAVMMPAPRVAGPDFQNRARVRFP